MPPKVVDAVQRLVVIREECLPEVPLLDCHAAAVLII